MVGLVCFHDKLIDCYSLELHESNLYTYFVGASVENVPQLFFKTLANATVAKSC